MTIAPKLTIPTGYESEQRSIERRRKIAEALLQQGLQQNPNMTSPWQAIAQVANAFAGRRMEKKADQRSDELNARIKGDFDTAATEFNNDAATLQPSQLVAKYRNNPMMLEQLKPYEAALQRALTEREALTTFNGKLQRQGDVVGQYDQGKPTDTVRRDATGNEFINPLAVNAQALGQGFEAPMAAGGQAAQAPQQGDPAKVLTVDQVRAASQSLKNGTAGWLQRNGLKVKVTTPQEARTLPPGTTIILPDGSEGVVP